MREAYRLNKAGFYNVVSANKKKIILSFLFIGKKSEDYKQIEASIISHLKRIESTLNKAN